MNWLIDWMMYFKYHLIPLRNCSINWVNEWLIDDWSIEWMNDFNLHLHVVTRMPRWSSDWTDMIDGCFQVRLNPLWTYPIDWVDGWLTGRLIHLMIERISGFMHYRHCTVNFSSWLDWLLGWLNNWMNKWIQASSSSHCDSAKFIEFVNYLIGYMVNWITGFKQHGHPIVKLPSWFIYLLFDCSWRRLWQKVAQWYTLLHTL